MTVAFGFLNVVFPTIFSFVGMHLYGKFILQAVLIVTVIIMNTYNPNVAPDPDTWNALEETKRVVIVERYHKRKRIRMPNHKAHAIFHVIVENQIAMGDELNAARTLRRLMSEGLDRHEALHAVGSVLAEHMHRMMSGESKDFNESKYSSDLDDLTAEKWRQMGQQEK